MLVKLKKQKTPIDMKIPASNAFTFLAIMVIINIPPIITPIAALVPEIPIP